MWKIVLIGFVAFQISCAKKNSADKARQARSEKAQAAANQTLQTNPSAKTIPEVDVTSQSKPQKKDPTSESPLPSKPEVKEEKSLVIQRPTVAVSEPPPEESKLAPSQAQKPAKNEPGELVKPEKSVPTATQVTLASDSEKIKTQNGFKIAFRNLDAVKRLSENEKIVIMRQKEVELTSPQALLGQLNEEQFCQIQLQGKFHPQDFLLLDFDHSSLVQTNKELDLYRTKMNFKNSNGVVAISCDHTTNNFYIEDMYQNLGQLIVVYGLENQVLDLKNFVNPRTERRRINAIKLKDVEKLKQIIINESTKEGLGISSGVVDSSDKLINFVAAGEKRATCSITNQVGEFKTDHTYIRVEKGILVDTPKDFPLVTLYSTYRADKEHFFELSCFMKKSEEWNVLFDAMKGVFEFGVLDRVAYNKTFDEIKALHTQKQ
jgi:hypothetical protein